MLASWLLRNRLNEVMGALVQNTSIKSDYLTSECKMFLVRFLERYIQTLPLIHLCDAYCCPSLSEWEAENVGEGSFSTGLHSMAETV